MIPEVAQIVGEIPSRSKCAWFRGSFTRAITFGTPYFSFASCADDHVVLVVAGEREQDVGRPRDPGALEHEELGRVAALHLMLELVLEALEPVAALLDQRHLVAEAHERAGDVRADLAAARDDDVHQAVTFAPGMLAGAHRLDQRVDRRLRRADGAEPPRRVEVRARGIEDADDDAVDAEALLGDLADDDVRVVAVGGDDDGVGLLDAGLRAAGRCPCRGRR